MAVEETQRVIVHRETESNGTLVALTRNKGGGEEAHERRGQEERVNRRAVIIWHIIIKQRERSSPGQNKSEQTMTTITTRENDEGKRN